MKKFIIILLLPLFSFGQYTITNNTNIQGWLKLKTVQNKAKDNFVLVWDSSVDGRIKKIHKDSLYIKGTKLASNGLNYDLDSVKLGGTLTDSTYIATNNKFYGYGNDYSQTINTNNFLGSGLNYNGLFKNITPPYKVVNGILDLTPFGGDSSTLYLGGINLLGGKASYMFFNPTKNDFVFKLNGASYIIPDNINISKSCFFGSGSTAAIVHEIQNETHEALGYAAIYDTVQGNRSYSNIYYGYLDANNIIKDISRVESSNYGCEMMFTHDTLNNYYNIINIDSFKISITVDSITENSINFYNTGDLQVTSYPNTRNDVDSVTQVQNTLFTDNTGKLKSKTIGFGNVQLLGGTVVVTDANATTSSKIFVTPLTPTHPGVLSVTKSTGGFTIDSNIGADDRYVDYIIYY